MRGKLRLGGNRHGWPWLSAVLIGALAIAACSRKPEDAAAALESAQLLFRKADMEGAARVSRQAVAHAPGPLAGRLRLLEAQSLLARNRTDEAWTILRSADIRSESDAVVSARRLMIEGAAFSRSDKFAEAHAAFDSAWSTAVRAGDVATQIEIQLTQALTCARQQDLARGSEFLKSALDLSVAHNDEYHQAATLLNMGLFAAKRHRFDEAALLLQRVLAICKRREDTGVIESAALGNLSMCYARLGDFDRAIEMRRQAIAAQEKGGLRLYLSQSFGELGYLHVLSGEPAQSVPWFRKASDLAEAGGVQREVAHWQGGLAEALTLTGDLNAAEASARRALAIHVELKDRSGEAWTRLIEARIAAMRGRSEDAIAILRKLLPEAERAQLAWEAHAELAGLYRTLRQPALASTHHRQALKLIEETSAELLRTESQITFLARLTGLYRRFVKDLVEDGADARALEIADAAHAKVLSERLRKRSHVRTERRAASDFRRIARLSNATLLTYWISPHGSYLWAVTGDAIRRFDLPPEPDIRQLVYEHTASIEQRMENPAALKASAAAKLYDAVVRPAESLIPHGSRVIVVPDGPLHAINLETLVVSRPEPHYWIEDVVLSIAPSFGLLEEDARTAVAASQRLLLIGDPVQADPAYPQLRFAAEELQSIEEQFPNSVRQVRQAATPSAYRKFVGPEFSVIHFAAHAEANRTSPLDSAIILSPERESYKLYSRDVLERPLSATLVTLSACRGAGARAYSGEGLVGFSWAFLDAGAKNVIAGLWDVSDRSTAKLMRRMYEMLAAAGVEPAEALRAAKLSMLRSGATDSRPWFWGPFQTYTRVWSPSSKLQARQNTSRH